MNTENHGKGAGHTEGLKTTMRYLGRHLVCLSGGYRWLDANGNPTGEEKLFSFSGFVMSFRGRWCLVTAGHVLHENLDLPLERKEITLVSCSIADYFGAGAKVTMPTPFDYEGSPKLYVNNKELGLDFGLLLMRPFYQTGLAANGVLPITEENWQRQGEVEFESYAILGFPDHLKPEPEVRREGSKAHLIGCVRPVLLAVDRLPDETREGQEFPWFVGKVRSDAEDFKSVVGMSGGPIFGFKSAPGGGTQYWAVALQSWWNKETRVVYGCPVPIFANVVEGVLDSGAEGAD